MTNKHAQIVEQLGGATALASRLGMHPNTVGKWKVRGIPPQHWHRVIPLSPGLTAEYLASTRPQGAQSSDVRRARRRCSCVAAQ